MTFTLETIEFYGAQCTPLIISKLNYLYVENQHFYSEYTFTAYVRDVEIRNQNDLDRLTSTDLCGLLVGNEESPGELACPEELSGRYVYLVSFSEVAAYEVYIYGELVHEEDGKGTFV